MTFPQLEDPFVLRKALDVSRKQLWELQDRLNQLGPDGGVSRWVKGGEVGVTMGLLLPSNLLAFEPNFKV